MAQLFRALAVLPDDSLILSTTYIQDSSQLSVSLVPRDLTPFSGLLWYQISMCYSDIHAGKTSYIKILNVFFKACRKLNSVSV